MLDAFGIYGTLVYELFRKVAGFGDPICDEQLNAQDHDQLFMRAS